MTKLAYKVYVAVKGAAVGLALWLWFRHLQSKIDDTRTVKCDPGRLQ
jgi:hypothetical protein